jgi:hypothetical protein
MENVDPLGIHTGESIVVAPSQTLTDRKLSGTSDKLAKKASNGKRTQLQSGLKGRKCARPSLGKARNVFKFSIFFKPYLRLL